MNKIALTSIVLGITLSIGAYAQDSAVGQQLRGEHKLARVKGDGEPYFIISGGDEAASINFIWQMNDGSYSLSRLSSGKMRVIFDENQETPTIKFRWSTIYSNTSTDSMMKNNVIYAVVKCKNSDWWYLHKDENKEPKITIAKGEQMQSHPRLLLKPRLRLRPIPRISLSLNGKGFGIKSSNHYFYLV